MPRLGQQIIKGEMGQALPAVLVLMLVGGLLIAPSLSYASTSLNVGQIVEENVRGIYAADAGVEYVLWQITNSIPPSEQLPQNVNQMAVAIPTEQSGRYALYYGDLIVVGEPPQNFPDYLAVEGEMEELAEVYKYTIRVTKQPQSGNRRIKLEAVGVRLPLGYSYQTGSADSFDGNLSTNEPDDPVEQDQAGAYMLNWALPTPLPEVSPEYQTATQTFYITGEGGQEGDYTWVHANDPDIGQVGEVTGTLYRIRATATRPEGGEITVVADAMWYAQEEKIRIILWQINPQEE